MNGRPFRTLARRGAVTLGAIAALFMVSSAGATAVTTTHDAVNQVEIATACSPYDGKWVVLRFHVEAGESTPAAGRVASVSANIRGAVGGANDGPFAYTMTPPDDAEYFATGDYAFDISWEFARSTIDGDAIEASVLSQSGEVLGHATTTVACIDGGSAATPHDVDLTVRVGVPKAVRMLEHVTFGADGVDPVSEVWVASPGLEGGTGAPDPNLISDVVLDAETSAALGASFSESVMPTDAFDSSGFMFGTVLTINPTKAGTYTLDWGVVTAPGAGFSWDGSTWSWAPGGERWGPASLTIHVIDGPILPADSQVTDGSRGNVATPTSATAGTSTPLFVGQDQAGEYVDIWLHSDPVYVGLYRVRADGTVALPVPASMANGDHKVIVTDEVGGFVGWNSLEITGGTAAASARNVVPRAATGLDERQEYPWPFIAVLALLPTGLALQRVRRRA